LARENRPSSEIRSAFSPRNAEPSARDEQAPETGQPAQTGRAIPGFGAVRRPRTAPRTAPVAPETARAILASLAATKLAAESELNSESEPEQQAKTSAKPNPKPQKTKRTKPDGSPRRFRPFVFAVVAGAGVAVLAGVAIGVVKASDRHSTTAAAGRAGTPTAAGAPAAASAGPSVTPGRTASADPDMKASPPAITAAVPEPPALGAWPLTVNALATTGKANGVAGKVTFSAGTAVFTGAGDSNITTPAVVLPTGPGASFTVSAWVDLRLLPTAATKTATAVSQGAGIDSAFDLQYFEPTNRWAFARLETDTAVSKVARTTSTATAQTNVWTHLVGVYTAGSGSVSLYVNGVDQGSTKDTTPFASTQGLEIGGALYNKAATDGFPGAIRDVQVFNLALNPKQIAGLN
jgi:Concanavalin A-like lectin/glucanases superfamily